MLQTVMRVTFFFQEISQFLITKQLQRFLKQEKLKSKQRKKLKGKLYGAVTTQVVADILAKNGFEIERKRIEIPGLVIKSVGNYHATIKLYEAQTAAISMTVKAQEDPNAAKNTEKKSDKKEPAKEEEAKNSAA